MAIEVELIDRTFSSLEEISTYRTTHVRDQNASIQRLTKGDSMRLTGSGPNETMRLMVIDPFEAMLCIKWLNGLLWPTVLQGKSIPESSRMFRLLIPINEHNPAHALIYLHHPKSFYVSYIIYLTSLPPLK